MLASAGMINYRVKVRGLTFLWGGDLVPTSDLSQVFLHFRVEETGETVLLSTRGSGKEDPLKLVGRLKPGQSFTVRLTGLAGVAVQTPDPVDTYVDCAVFAAAAS